MQPRTPVLVSPQNITGVSMTTNYSLSPKYLNQPIQILNGFGAQSTYSLFTVNMGTTANPDVEREVQEVVGTYGRQIGHIQEALEVLLRHVPMSKLSPAEKETLKVLKRDISSVRQIKQKHED